MTLWPSETMGKTDREYSSLLLLSLSLETWEQGNAEKTVGMGNDILAKVGSISVDKTL